MKPKARPLISKDHQDHYYHLLQGTDWTLRGNGNSEMTAVEVISIRARYMAGEGAKTLGVEYGVGHKTITNIVRGVTWNHLPLPDAWVDWVNDKIMNLERIR